MHLSDFWLWLGARRFCCAIPFGLLTLEIWGHVGGKGVMARYTVTVAIFPHVTVAVGAQRFAPRLPD